jgi:hypothetical protein
MSSSSLSPGAAEVLKICFLPVPPPVVIPPVVIPPVVIPPVIIPPVVIPPIEESIDLGEPLRSVSERYYTPFYRVDEDRTRRHDLCLLVHSNRIALISLAPSHPILEQGLAVKRVDCTINKRLDRKDNKAVGKSKKGGQSLFKDSVLCHLEVCTVPFHLVPYIGMGYGENRCLCMILTRDSHLR